MKRKLFFIVLFFSVLGAYIVWATGYFYPTHIYSPGDLAKKHLDISNCKKCHIPFQGVPSTLCQANDCHPAKKLLSVSVPSIKNELHKQALGKGCMECHTDHKGIEGRITRPFKHALVAVTIADECFSCHDADYHRAHRGKYGIVCNQCHTSIKDWKKVHFDHKVNAEGKTCVECHSLPQEGLHVYYSQQCEKCHTIEAWKPATFDHTLVTRVTCITCHEEARDKAHPGKYGNVCETCHGTLNWEVLYFDHDELTVGERCDSCHNKPLDSLHSEVSSECEICHSTIRWKPAAFEHINYFPLKDEHFVSCKMCHETKDYKAYTCINCHVHDTKHIRHEHEEHGISNYPRCLDCHSVKLYGRRYGTPKTHEGLEEEDDREEHHRQRDRKYEYEYEDEDDD